MIMLQERLERLPSPGVRKLVDPLDFGWGVGQQFGFHTAIGAKPRRRIGDRPVQFAMPAAMPIEPNRIAL